MTVSWGVVTASNISLSSTVKDMLRIGADEEGFVSKLAYEISKHRCFEREMHGLNTQVAF